MNSLWVRVLVHPSSSAEVIIQDEEAPLLALVPVFAGFFIGLAWTAFFNELMTIETQVAFAALFGPPLVMVISWLGRLIFTGVCRLTGEGANAGAVTGIIAWSWLPLLYLSLAAFILSHLVPGGPVALALQAIGFAWQLYIMVQALRSVTKFSLLRIIPLLFLSIILSLLGIYAAGYALSFLVGDMFKMAGAL